MDLWFHKEKGNYLALGMLRVVSRQGLVQMFYLITRSSDFILLDELGLDNGVFQTKLNTHRLCSCSEKPAEVESTKFHNRNYCKNVGNNLDYR